MIRFSSFDGLVEITIRESVYDHLRGVLRRYTLCEETSADYEWLAQFLDDLEMRDAERLRHSI